MLSHKTIAEVVTQVFTTKLELGPDVPFGWAPSKAYECDRNRSFILFG